MSHTKTITVPGFGTVTLHFHSKVARLGGATNNMCVSPHTILVARDRINQWTLAHEYGHRPDALRLGWRYLPWVLYHYAKSGYANSLPERNANEFMQMYAHLFPEEVRCDCAALHAALHAALTAALLDAMEGK